MLGMVAHLLKKVLCHIIDRPLPIKIVIIEEHTHFHFGIIIKLRRGNIAFILLHQFLKDIIQLIGTDFPIHEGILMD